MGSSPSSPHNSSLSYHNRSIAPSNDVDSDDEDVPCSISPPKMAKLLQPRRQVALGGEVASGTESSAEGWIPLVSTEEWNKLPLSLKLQVCL
jgi:hypothetical protein